MISAFDSTVTLFNRLGEDENGNGLFSKTVIDGVRTVASLRSADGADALPRSDACVYFSLSRSKARDGKSYISPSAWSSCDKNSFFTFTSDGDCLVPGECTESLPPEDSMLITEASYFDARLKRLRHVKITCSF